MSLEKRNFTGAILDAFYYLSDLLRKKSGAEGDGAVLIGQALGGAAPKIKLNRLQSDSDWNVQRGVEQMLRGFYQAVRNPRSHEKIIDSEEDAQVLIVFIGYLVRQIDQARSQFSRMDFQKRVLDPDFVPQERYAKILVDEIPVGQRLEVFLDIYRAKETGKPENLRHFFKVLLAELTDDERRQVHEVISEELTTADDEATMRLIIGSFESDIWPHLGEAPRLRIENKLIRSVREGRYVRLQKKCRGGAFGTWAGNLLPYFSLKKEFLYAVYNKLSSKIREEEDYVFQYIFDDLTPLADTMPPYFESEFLLKLKQGNVRFYDALNGFGCPWDQETWTPELTKAYDEFKAAENENAFQNFDDDIPF
jgi:uncharacterized protein (TIGR02391 family)